MRVVVTGGTGLIGTALCRRLVADGHDVVVLTRRAQAAVPAGVAVVPWTAQPTPTGTHGGPARERPAWWEAVDGADVAVNLAGESIAARRWSAAQKERILQSRLRATRALVQAMEAAQRPPRLLLSGSAVGYYGPRGDEVVTETGRPGTDFLSRVSVAWEEEARRAEAAGVRVALLRTGVVLAREGGALPRLVLPFRFFAGGPLGSGRQWVPWIHLDDLVDLITFLLGSDDAAGPYNGTAPEPVTNREFARVLGRVLGRPAWLPAPAPALRLVLGEMADALLLSGQRAVPERALAAGFRFRYPDLEKALRHLLGRGSGPGP